MAGKQGKRRHGGVRHILFVANLAHDASRTIMAGVISRLSSRPDAMLLVRGFYEPDIGRECPLAEEDVDGVISCVGFDDPVGHWFSRGRRGPPVAIVATGPGASEARRRTITLVCDEAEVGRAAAELLVRHDLKEFGFVGVRVNAENNPWNAARRDAYQSALARHGFTARVYDGSSASADAAQDAANLSAWLRALPKPCGVFAANDLRAMNVLDACRMEGLSVAEQIQVVGVDNEPWICEKTSPTLTSIEPDFEGAGSRAAEAILAMIDGAKGGAAETFGIRRVVQRMSTTDVHGDAGRAVRARDYIAAHADERIAVTEIARRLNCSKRTLQKSYAKVFGIRLTDEIAAAKVAKAKKLLSGKDTTIDEIPELVGFESPNHFKRVFKARTGMSMSQFRRRARDGA